MLNIYLAIDSIIVLCLAVLAFFALSSGGVKKRENRLFTGFTVLAAVWIVSNHIGNDISLPPEVSGVANYFIFSSSFGAMILMMKIMSHIVGDVRSLKFIRRAEPLLWVACVIAATPLTTTGVELQDTVYAVTFGPFLPVYGALLVFMVLYTYVIVRGGLRRARGAKLAQLRILSTSLNVSIPLVLLLSFILPSLTGVFAFTEFGATPILVLIGGFYYSIIRHRLFDVRLAAVRAVAYTLSLLTLSGLYFVVAYFVSVLILEGNSGSGVSTNPVNILLALLIAFIFQPVRGFFDRVTDSVFYRNRYDTNEFIVRVNESLTSTTDLRTLLQRAAAEIGSTLKAEYAHFVVVRSDGRHVSSGTKGHPVLSVSDVEQLTKAVGVDRGRLFREGYIPEGHPVQPMFKSKSMGILIPLRRRHNVIGFFILGHQLSGHYGGRDVSVLEAISDSLLIAIQNSLSAQEVRDLNTHLQERIREATRELTHSNAQLKKLDATKDEFISMASHQLRTPLTAVKGYISMVLDGDMGKITPQQRRVLEQAFESSQRMVFLIGDFLNVSRIQTGRFVLELAEKNLADLIPEEIDQLTDTARMRRISLVYEGTDALPPLMIDENKIRQVMMNFIDNAIYYSRPDSTIKVQLYRDANRVVFKVIDGGIGVPKAEQPRLFTKFYRASNARKQRPDGTGIGLYMAKKVILAHGGTVIFETAEGKGSTFGFKLPLKNKTK